jgi:hypothetical protein
MIDWLMGNCRARKENLIRKFEIVSSRAHPEGEFRMFRESMNDPHDSGLPLGGGVEKYGWPPSLQRLGHALGYHLPFQTVGDYVTWHII